MTRKDSTCVTICVPTFNGEKYLAESLQSIINQTYENIEILIVDDQSSDSTVEIVEEFIAKDTRVRLHINDRNLGLVGNWSQCISLASGDWIKLHFQDDLMVPGTISEMMSVATAHDVKLVITDREYFFEDGADEQLKAMKRLSWFFPAQAIITPSQMAELLMRNGIGQNFIGEPILGLIHRDLIRQFGDYDPLFNQIVDFEYWLRMCLNVEIGFIPMKLHFFRVHGESQGARNAKSPGVGVSNIDKVNLCHKFLSDSAFQNFRDLIGKEEVKAMVVRNITKVVRNNGYYRMRGKISRDRYEFYDKSIWNLLRGIGMDLLYFLKLK